MQHDHRCWQDVNCNEAHYTFQYDHNDQQTNKGFVCMQLEQYLALKDNIVLITLWGMQHDKLYWQDVHYVEAHC